MKAKRLSKRQRSPPDRISALPQPIIETILCLLPIEEAARTSTLSKEWRYKWTKIPKLVFRKTTVYDSAEDEELDDSAEDVDLYDSAEDGDSSSWGGMSYEEYDSRKRDTLRRLIYAIKQVMLSRQGPIHEFTLSMDADRSFYEIDRVINHLAKNHTLKSLTLDFDGPNWHSYCVPESVFSLHNLTNLYLKYCDFDLIPIFDGFASLTSLTLDSIRISEAALLDLLSNCPSLKTLFFIPEDRFSFYKNNYIVELFKCLPVIEDLTLFGNIIQSLVLPLVPKDVFSLIHLKYFCIKDVSFGDRYALTFLGFLMKCSPNLEKIKLQIETDGGYDRKKEDEYSLILKDYPDVWLEHLNELEIVYIRNFKLELVFVEFVLARSPNLKKVKFEVPPWIKNSKSTELKMLKTLKRAPRASQAVQFVKIKNSLNFFR